MGTKNEEIAKLKSKQTMLRTKVKQKQKYIPYTLIYLTLAILAILFFYDYIIYTFFDNHLVF